MTDDEKREAYINALQPGWDALRNGVKGTSLQKHKDTFEVTVLIRDKYNREDVATLLAKALYENGYTSTVLLKEE